MPSSRSLATLLCSDSENSEDIICILEQLEKAFSIPDSWGNAHRHLFHALPLYPNQDEHSNYEFDWLKVNSVFIEWLQGSDRKFLHFVSSSTLLNESSHPGSLLSSLKGHDKSNRPRHVFYFRFEKYDVRLDNWTAMLTTFIAQALSQIPSDSSLDGSAIKWLERVKVTSDKYLPKKDLLLVFKSLCTFYRLQSFPVILVIWNLDGCADPLSWLVDFIANINSFSETLPRILFASSGSGTITEILKKINAVTINASGEPRNSGYQDRCGHEMTKLIRTHPPLSAFEWALNKALARHRHHNTLDIPTAQWICRHVRSLVAVSEATDVSASLEHLSNITTQQLLLDMMATIPPHKSGWAKSILAWLMVSFRPLTIWELEDARSLKPMSDPSRNYPGTSSDFAGELQACFSGLIVVENNEVSYVHPIVRQYLTQQECVAQPWYTSPADAHLGVLQTLLGHFFWKQKTSPDFASTLEDTTLSHSVFFRQNLRTYAAEFWLPHCLEAKKSYPVSVYYFDAVREFFDNPSAINAWASFLGFQARPTEPKSKIEGERVFSREAMVTLATRYNRHALTISDLDELCSGWSSNYDLVQAALLEAVKSNDAQLLKTIPMPPLEKLDVKALLESVSVCEDAEIVSYLFNRIKGLAKFPETFLKRTAFLGVSEAISSTIEGTISCDNDRPYSDLFGDLLVEAILSGETEVVGDLAKAMSKNGQKVPLSTMNDACRVGEPRSVYHILSTGFDMASFELVYEQEEPLYTACAYGNWEVAQTLVTKRVFSNQEGKRYLWSSLQVAVTRGFVECTTCVLDLINPKGCSEPDRESLWEVLIQGIINGQVETCRVLLENGVDLNYRELWEKQPVLSYTFNSRNTDLIELLLKYEVPLEATNNLGNTPVYIASTQGLKDVVGFLIQKKAKVNARANFGGTALYQACIKNHLDVVKVLLDNGADVRLSTYTKNWSPLEAAYDYPKILRLLVEKNPDYKRVSGGATALWRAARGGYTESVELLLSKKGCEIDYYPMGYKEEDDGLTPLAMAARAGHTKVVRLLLEAGADVNHVNPVTSDFILKFVSDEEVLVALLEYGPDLKLADKEGNTALHSFAADGKLPLLKRLVNVKADINALNTAGMTPLHLAVGNKGLEIIECLLSKGADVNLSESYFGPPLHHACQYSSLEVVKLLIKHKADVNALNELFGTPLACVCISNEEQFDKIKYLVEEAGAKLDTPGGQHGPVLNDAMLRCDMEVVKYLVENGGKEFLNLADQLGRPPLFYACYRVNGALEAVEYLTSQDVKISLNDKDKMGRTILHCAAATHNVNLIKKLVEINKQLLDGIDNDNWTPLHWAMRNAYRPRPNAEAWSSLALARDDLVETVDVLLDGASQGLSKIGDTYGREWTPLKLARYHGVYDMVKEHLAPPTKADGNDSSESLQLHQSPVAKFHYRFCNACFCVGVTCPVFLPFGILLTMLR